MKMSLLLIGNIDRLKILSRKFDLKECVFIGDGIFDHFTMKKSGYSITIADSLDHVKKNANFVTKRRGGNRAVAEACLHLLKNFLILILKINLACKPVFQTIFTFFY